MCYFRERAEIEEKYRNVLIKKQEAELAKKGKDFAKKIKIWPKKIASLQNYKLNWHRRSRYIILQIIIVR